MKERAADIASHCVGGFVEFALILPCIHGDMKQMPLTDAVAKIISRPMTYTHFKPHGHMLVANVIPKEINDAPTPLMGPPLALVLALADARTRRAQGSETIAAGRLKSDTARQHLGHRR